MYEKEVPQDEEKIYDRQIRLWGIVAQNRMINSTVLVIGLSGINIETCKNLVLSGINVTILDNNIVDSEMIENVFFLEEEDKGQYVSFCIFKELKSINKLITLNAYVGYYNDLTDTFDITKQYSYNGHNDTVEEKDMNKSLTTKEFVKSYTSVCFSCEDYPLYKLINMNEYCHNANIGFSATMCNGKFAFLFIDFNKYIMEESYFKKAVNDTDDIVNKDRTNNNNSTKNEIKYCKLSDFLKSSFECFPKKTNIMIYHLFALILFEKQKKIDNNNQRIDEKEFLNFCMKFSFNKDNLTELCKLYKVPFPPACSIMGGVASQEIRKYVAKQHETIPNFSVFDMNQSIVCTASISSKK